MGNYKNILIRMPNWLGDFIMALAALHHVRKCFPNACITVMCQAPLQQLLQEDPCVDQVLFFSKESMRLYSRKARKNVVKTLRLQRYDLGVLFTNSFSSAWYFWKAFVKKRIGYKAHFRSFFLTHGKKLENTHQVISYLRLVQEGFSSLDPSLDTCFAENTVPFLHISEKEKKEAKSILQKNGYTANKYLIGINAFAAYGPAKCWPMENFRSCAKKLLKQDDVFLVFFGDQQCKEQADTFLQDLGPCVLNWVGKTSLRTLCSMMSLCAFFLTNDSGPMHIAAALQLELLAIFGSTSPEKTGPYKKGEVLQKKVACSPCYHRVCPIDFRCMKRISVDEVVSIIEQKKVRYVENSKKKTFAKSF